MSDKLAGTRCPTNRLRFAQQGLARQARSLGGSLQSEELGSIVIIGPPMADARPAAAVDAPVGRPPDDETAELPREPEHLVARGFQ